MKRPDGHYITKSFVVPIIHRCLPHTPENV